MAWRFSSRQQAYTSLIVLFMLALALSGCALALPGSHTSATSSAAATTPGTIKELELDVSGGITQIIFDHNGNLWFTGQSSLEWISPSGRVTRINVNDRVRSVSDLTPGPGGNLWFIGRPLPVPVFPPINESIGFVTPDGQIQEWTLPPLEPGFTQALEYLIAGPDGNMWYARSDFNTSVIGRITPSGSHREYTVNGGLGHFNGLAAGPDGNLWFSMSQFREIINSQTHTGMLLYTGGLIGRVTPGGNVQQVNDPFTSSFPGAFSPGPDGNLWFANYKIVNSEPAGSAGWGIIDRTGKVTKAPANAVGTTIKGSDGNLWSIDVAHNAIMRVTPAGVEREFTVPTANAHPLDLVVGKDGNLWFAESLDKIGRITPAGQITEFTITSPGAMIVELVAGPDGNLWFTEDFAPPEHNGAYLVSDIGRVTV